MNKLNLLLPLAALALGGCGGSSGGSGSDDGDGTETGVFLDSAVVNIGYSTESGEGVTNEEGEFAYAEGETVTFFIGDLQLPSAPAAARLTPLDLAQATDTSDSRVVNMIRLLQTLDDNGDPSDGITITETARNAATQVDFTLPEDEFEASSAVVNLVANAGSENTTLISRNQALAHFEGTLADEQVEFVANANIRGVWTSDETDNEFLAFIFFRDGTYVHMEVDEETPFDVSGEESGMEWGTYTRDDETGQLAIDNIFDENGDTGLTDFVPNSGPPVFAQVAGDTLTLQFDDNQDGTIGDGESLDFSRATSEDPIVGAWRNDTTDNDLLAFVFFGDGTYAHMEVDEEAPFDEEGEESGMEWGTYTRDSDTGQLTVTQTFDANQDTGLTDFVGEGAPGLFAQVSGNTLTLQFDDNDNGTIDEDESLDFVRN